MKIVPKLYGMHEKKILPPQQRQKISLIPAGGSPILIVKLSCRNSIKNKFRDMIIIAEYSVQKKMKPYDA